LAVRHSRRRRGRRADPLELAEKHLIIVHDAATVEWPVDKKKPKTY
jgi:hypothetical protein